MGKGSIPLAPQLQGGQGVSAENLLTDASIGLLSLRVKLRFRSQALQAGETRHAYRKELGNRGKNSGVKKLRQRLGVGLIGRSLRLPLPQLTDSERSIRSASIEGCLESEGNRTTRSLWRSECVCGARSIA